MITYASIGPFVVRRGRGHVAQRAEAMMQCGNDDSGDFTQVRATGKRKTLLLLWWIDGAIMVAERSTLAQQGRQWLHAYECVDVQLSNLANPLYGCHGPPFIG